MTWILLAIIALLVLFNVPSTRPHAQRAWNAVRGWRPRWWMVAIAILAIPVVLPSVVPWARAQGERVLAVWNGTPPAATTTPAPKQEAGSVVDPQKVYNAAKEGAKEGATEAVKTETPKAVQAAVSEAVKDKSTTPAPAQQPASQPQAPVVGPSGYTDGQLAVIGKIAAEAAVVKAEAAAEAAKAAAKAAKDSATEADDSANRSATNADAAKKATDGKVAITEIATTLGKVSIDRSVTGILRLSVVNGSTPSIFPSGRKVWIEQERTASISGNILFVGNVGNAFSSRDFQTGVVGVTGKYRIWIEDPNGSFKAPNGTRISVSDWVSITR